MSIRRLIVICLVMLFVAAFYWLDTRRVEAQARIDRIAFALYSHQIWKAEIIYCDIGLVAESYREFSDLLDSTKAGSSIQPKERCAKKVLFQTNEPSQVSDELKVSQELVQVLKNVYVYPFTRYAPDNKIAILLYHRSGREVTAISIDDRGMGGSLRKAIYYNNEFLGGDEFPILYIGYSLYDYLKKQLGIRLSSYPEFSSYPE